MELINFADKEIRTKMHENELWYSVIDVVSTLTDSKNPSAYWRKLRSRLKDEGSDLVTNCHKLKLPSSDGKFYATDCATRETLLRLIQSIPSPSVEPFKIWLANAREQNIKETENPLILIDKLKASLENKGYDNSCIHARIRSILVRKQLTDEWKN